MYQKEQLRILSERCLLERIKLEKRLFTIWVLNVLDVDFLIPELLKLTMLEEMVLAREKRMLLCWHTIV